MGEGTRLRIEGALSDAALFGIGPGETGLLVFYAWACEHESERLRLDEEALEQVSESPFMNLVDACQNGRDLDRICRACREVLHEYRMNRIVNLMSV